MKNLKKNPPTNFLFNKQTKVLIKAPHTCTIRNTEAIQLGV